MEDGYRVTRVTDPDGHVATTIYAYYVDTHDNRIAGYVGLLYEVAGPDGVKTRYSGYDKNGNPLEIKTIGTDNRAPCSSLTP